MSFDEVFNVIVIGAGHAGCEAASAAARLGAETGLITLNLDLDRSDVVQSGDRWNRERTSRARDRCARRHHGPRDRSHRHSVPIAESFARAGGSVTSSSGRSHEISQRDAANARSDVKSSSAAGKSRRLCARSWKTGGRLVGRWEAFGAQAVVVATGTFLNGLIHTGRRTYSGGRAGEPASIELSERSSDSDFPVGR
jgi:tRNA uridine 5-carboxymethylaminomethyl modification enzyme